MKIIKAHRVNTTYYGLTDEFDLVEVFSYDHEYGITTTIGSGSDYKFFFDDRENVTNVEISEFYNVFNKVRIRLNDKLSNVEL